MLLYYFQIQDLISGLVRKHQLNFDLIEFEIMMCNYDGKKKKKLFSLNQLLLQKPEIDLFRYQKHWMANPQGCIQQDHWPAI